MNRRKQEYHIKKTIYFQWFFMLSTTTYMLCTFLLTSLYFVFKLLILWGLLSYCVDNIYTVYNKFSLLTFFNQKLIM